MFAVADEPSTPVEEALADLDAALDQVQELALSGLSMGELEQLCLGLLETSERIEAAKASVLAHADRVAMVRRSGGGFKSLGAHLSASTGGPTLPVNGARNLGRWLADFVVFEQAWGKGEITEAHLRELRRVHNHRLHHQMVLSQDMFVEHAQTLDWTGFLTAVGYWLWHVDPDGIDPAERNRKYGYTARTKANGDVEVSALFDPILGEAVLTAVEAETKRVIDADKASSDDGVPSRGFRQNQMLAFVNLVVRGAERESGGFPVPLINIVMSQGVAEALLERVANDDDSYDLPVDYDDIDGRCETIRGTPLDPRTVVAPLLVGRLRRQVVNARGRTIDLGHDTRLFPWHFKNALLVESRGRSTTRGDDTPFMWLVADHVHPHSLGGVTSLANGEIKSAQENAAKGNTPEP